MDLIMGFIQGADCGVYLSNTVVPYIPVVLGLLGVGLWAVLAIGTTVCDML